MNKRTRVTALAVAAAAALSLAACSSESDAQDTTEAINEPVTVTFDGGIHILDGETLEVKETVSLDGFNRVNPAGDDTHVAVSTEAGFQFLDAAAGAMTDIKYDGPKPGHVVVHADKTVLYMDGTGVTSILDSDDLAAEAVTYTAAEPHHGVSVVLEDGTMVTTLGNEEKRPGAMALDADFAEIARNESCEGVHGEAVAQGEILALGCKDGALLFKNGAWVKVPGAAPFAKIGTVAGSPESTVLLSDYKVDPDAEREFPEQFALIDTVAEKITVVPMPEGVSYSFRSLGRGPHGDALILGTDGKLHVVDPATGAIENSWQVVGEWQEPMDWQEARPALFVRDHDVYVTDPATRKVFKLNADSGEVEAEVTLDNAPNEISGVSGAHGH
ncbi:zinc metallochaperone AztD [Rhodococcus gannanensis]|uniref:Zinc metallochaperone AztD n=1 Tax=Rhodococcus gannanensis TaxID=1960308 RepID=A0ABW4P877_9NOCA